MRVAYIKGHEVNMKEKGFLLIDIIIALLLFAGGASVLAYYQWHHHQSILQTVHYNQALTIAFNILEQPQIPFKNSTQIMQQIFTVHTKSEPYEPNCQELTVQVEWNEGEKNHMISLRTIRLVGNV